MRPVRILRDPAHSSRVLILLELRRRPASRLRPLAEAVGLTQQAVSIYMKGLEAEGLARRLDGGSRLTQKGEEWLEAEIGALKGFADRASRELVKVETCVAIAGQDVHEGERVGLFMERGRLVARPARKSPSWGIAVRDASRGQDVFVRDLEGIVEIEEASLTILEAPAGEEGGSLSVDPTWVKAEAASRREAFWGALDEVGEGILRGAGVAWRFEFAPFETARSALARGASAVFVGAPESVALLVAAIESAKAAGKVEHLPYEVVRAKAAGGKGSLKRRT